MDPFHRTPGPGSVKPRAPRPSINMALNVEPVVLGAEIEEPSKITITIQTNGCRVVHSTGDSLSCQSPGIGCAPPKRKERPENGMNKEACNSQKPSLQGLHYKACNGSVSLVTSLQASAPRNSTLGDNLTQNGSSCSGTVNNSNGEPSEHFLNNEVSGPSWSRDGGQRPELVSPHPSKSTTSAEDDLFIAGSASNRFVSQKLRSHCSEEVNGFIGDGILLDKSIDHSSTNRSGGLRSTLEDDSDPRREVWTPRRSKSPVTPNVPLAEASAVYRLSQKQKIESSTQNPLTGSRSPSPTEKTQTSARSQSKHPKTSSDVVDLDKTSEEPVQITHTTCCRLPFNGHIEDKEHYRFCQIIIHGIILREEHASWLNAITDYCLPVQQVVDYVIMSSCKQVLLSSKCTEETCKCKHTIDLNFEIPPKLFNAVFDIFTKWFLGNAVQPNFRAILLMLSRLPKDHDSVIMIVLSYAMMILKLPNKIYRQTLCIKLVEIMVNTLELKPWEAVRTLLVFAVTPETGQSEILDLLSSLEVSKKLDKKQQLTNHLYESVSCLWHISNTFVCPSDLIFNVLKECLAQMPEDLKLTKDRIVTNLLKLPRRVLRKGFHLIDKFLSKYYPMNSEIVRVFRSSVLYGKDVSSSEDARGAYGSCRVRSTGPVNPHWDYWDVQDARAKAFESCLKNTKTKQRKEGDITFPPMPDIPLGNDFEEDAWCDDMYKILGRRSYSNPLRPHDLSADLECLVKSLYAENFAEVVKILSSYDEPHKKNSLDQCMQMLQREFENCNRAEIHRIAIEIFRRLKGLLSDENSTKSAFVRMLNSLVIMYYKDTDYATALKLIKSMRIAGVNHLEHVPEEIDQNTFIAVCSHIHFQARLYPEAIRTLMYKNCLALLRHPFDGRFTGQEFALEVIVKNMLQHFLRKRYADLALSIFKIIFLAQKDLHDPLDIGKFYEGVVFLSFVSDLKQNACAMGDGANLYIAVDRICGNDEPFHSITYRSLLVELHRVDSPEDIIRRVLWICLQRRIYPDFSKGPISPLVLESYLAKEEISIYLKHYFTFFIAQNDQQRLTDRPFVVGFTQSPTPATKPFPVSNDIMKTPRTLPEALERFKSALDEIHRELDADFFEDRVTIPVQGVEKILDVFKRL